VVAGAPAAAPGTVIVIGGAGGAGVVVTVEWCVRRTVARATSGPCMSTAAMIATATV
jgi:hypothetical protein